MASTNLDGGADHPDRGTYRGTQEHPVQFYHSEVRDGNPLTISTGLDQANWGYQLNTANFPTYAGEVVQILSIFIDDLTLQGTVQNYETMESIYKFFGEYLQIATQGNDPHPTPGVTSFNQSPMTMRYPERGWEFKIIPKSIPGFREGRDVVAPTWQLLAAVIEEEGPLEHIKDLISAEVIGNSGDLDFALKGEVGYSDRNPFSDPFATGTEFDATKTAAAYSSLGDYYNKFIPAYLQGHFDDLTGTVGSQPAFGRLGIQPTPSAPARPTKANPTG